MRLFPRYRPGTGLFRLCASAVWTRISNILGGIEGDGKLSIEKPLDAEGMGWRVTLQPPVGAEGERKEPPRLPFTGYYVGDVPKVAFGTLYLNGERVIMDITSNEYYQDLRDGLPAYAVLYNERKDGRELFRYGVYAWPDPPTATAEKLCDVKLAFFGQGEVKQYHEGELYLWDFKADDASLEAKDGEYQLFSAGTHDAVPLADEHDVLLRGFTPAKRTPDFHYSRLKDFRDTLSTDIEQTIYHGAASGTGVWYEFLCKVAKAVMFDHHDKDPPGIENHPACTLYDPTCTVPENTLCLGVGPGTTFDTGWVPISAALGDMGAPNKAAMTELLAAIEEEKQKARPLVQMLNQTASLLFEAQQRLSDSDGLPAEAEQAAQTADQTAQASEEAVAAQRAKVDAILGRIEAINARIQALGG